VNARAILAEPSESTTRVMIALTMDEVVAIVEIFREGRDAIGPSERA
jgi:hypothetical protein